MNDHPRNSSRRATPERRRRKGAVAALVLALPCAGSAQPVDLYGFDPRSIALGGTQASADGDFAAAYYNPALLLGADRPSFGVGYAFMRPDTWGVVIQEQVGGVEFGYRAPPDYSAVTFGMNVPLWGKLFRRLAAGFAIAAPFSHVYRGRLIDESEPSFYRYDSAPDRLQIAGGMAVRPVEPLTVGAGAQLASNFLGEARFRARIGTGAAGSGGKIVERNLTNEVAGLVAPVVGVAAKLGERVRLYANWRSEILATYYLPIAVTIEQATSSGDVAPIDTLGVITAGVTQFAPHTFNFGARVQIRPGLLASADLGFEMWSRAPPPEVSIDITADENGPFQVFLSRCVTSRQPSGEPAPGDKCPPGAEVPVGFHDIFVPRLGVEWEVREGWTARAGYFYRPSPAPDQDGQQSQELNRQNFLDPAVHGFSIGGGWAFADPLEFGQKISVDASIQTGIFAPVDMVKRRPYRLPDYRVGGWTLDLAVSVRWLF